MTKKNLDKKNKLITYNKYASYLHLLNFVSQVGLYYYLKKEAKTDSRYEPFDIKITDMEYGLVGDWDQMATLRGDATYNTLESTIKNNFGGLRKREVVKYKIPLALIVASFSFMSFIAHTALIMLNNRYYSWIKNYKVNFVRWIEYFISSPTMMLAIAGLCNVNEYSLVQNILVSTAITNVFGLMAEIIKDDPNYGFMSRIFYMVGFLPFRASWSPIISRFMKSIENAKGGKDSTFAKGYIKIFGEAEYDNKFPQNFNIPDFVKYTVYGLYGLYYFFPVNFNLQNYILPKRSKLLGINYDPEDSYYYGEIGYIALSYISKATLSWLIFSGTRRPNDEYFNNTSFSLIGGKKIKPWHIYTGLLGLGGTALYYSNKYKLDDTIEVKPIKSLTTNEQIYKSIKDDDIDNMSDDEIRKLWKKLKALNPELQ